MATKKQFYWQQGDWALLEAYVANKEAYPAGITPSHLHVEDLRKYCWLLEHIHAGNYNDEALEWSEETSRPAYNPANPIYKYAGEWEVTTNDASHGVNRRLRWRNKNDLYNNDCYQGKDPAFIGPPTSIHPSDNTWITANANWQLVASPNYYYDWDMNFAGQVHFNEVIFQDGSEVMRNDRLSAVTAYYSQQVDPKEQYKPVIYTDTETKTFQFKEKVALDKTYITVAAYLGAVLPIWSRMKVRWVSGEKDGIDRRDAWGILGDLNSKVFNGNQYCNYSGQEKDNSNVGGSYEWSFNPKINTGLQNKIEVILSNNYFRLPADATFKANFRRLYFYDYVSATTYSTGQIVYRPSNTLIYRSLQNGNQGHSLDDTAWWEAADEDEYNGWDDYPNVNDECWGENEAGIELFLKKNGKYDWYFDYNTSTKYVPFNLAEIAIQHSEGIAVGNPPYPSLGQLQTEWDLIPAGIWRRSEEHGLGRASPYMRSYEMGEPAHRKDAWNPSNDFIITGSSPEKHWTYPRTIGSIEYDVPAKWCGARTNDMPTLDYFDDKWADIIKTGDYSFTVAGDITANLKIGWMIHLYSGSYPAVTNDTDIIRPAYVLSCVYDSVENVTAVLISELVGSFTKIGWNKEISQRHDGINAAWEGVESSFTYKIYYALSAELLLELKELLDWCEYKRVDLTMTLKYCGLIGTSAPDAGTSWSQVFSLAKSRALAQVTYLPAEAPWVDGGTVFTVGTEVEGGGDWNEYTEQWEWGCLARIFAVAIQATWTDLNLITLPPAVFMRVSIEDIWQNPTPPDPGAPQYYSQTSGTLSNRIIYAPEPKKIRYKHISMAANGSWYFMFPENWFPYGTYPNGDPVDNISMAGYARIDASIISSPQNLYTQLDWEKVPESVWQRMFIEHFDMETTPVVDTKPPRPNPPVFNYNPQAYFLYKAAVGENPPYFELRIRATICLCEDYEGSVPVKYRTICDDDEGLISEWLSTRETDVYVKDIPLGTPITLSGITTNPSGTVTRISCSPGSMASGDKVQILGTVQNDGLWTVESVGADYFEIDKGWYIEEEFGVDAAAYNISDIYDADDWAVEACKDYKFESQAKDSASPTNNLTGIGRLTTLEAPDEYPADIIDEMGGIVF